MDDKVFKQLQKKFFYVPLAIGWFFVILACLLVFAVTRIQTIIDLENSLLKATTYTSSNPKIWIQWHIILKIIFLTRRYSPS